MDSSNDLVKNTNPYNSITPNENNKTKNVRK
jgi:hypothetical protein